MTTNDPRCVTCANRAAALELELDAESQAPVKPVSAKANAESSRIGTVAASLIQIPVQSTTLIDATLCEYLSPISLDSGLVQPGEDFSVRALVRDRCRYQTLTIGRDIARVVFIGSVDSSAGRHAVVFVREDKHTRIYTLRPLINAVPGDRIRIHGMNTASTPLRVFLTLFPEGRSP